MTTRVDVTALYSDEYIKVITKESDSLSEIIYAHHKEIVRLKEATTVAALKRLGWLPPEEAKDLKARLAHYSSINEEHY